VFFLTASFQVGPGLIKMWGKVLVVNIKKTEVISTSPSQIIFVIKIAL